LDAHYDERGFDSVVEGSEIGSAIDVEREFEPGGFAGCGVGCL
jgi:hypothetical protein